MDFILAIVYYRIILFLFCLHSSNSQIELAGGKETSVSKQYLGRATWDSSKVVDGDASTNVFCGSCVHTEPNGESTAWWQVDLNGTFVISRIEIYNAEPYTPPSTCPATKADYPAQTTESDRLKGYSIYLSSSSVWTSGEMCHKDPSGNGEFPDLFQNNTCEGIGSVITIFNDHKATSTGLNGAAIVICEVKVYGCPKGTFGMNCSMNCSDNCLDTYCRSNSGVCVQCADGWLGDYCDIECPDGRYGQNCSMECGSCKDGDPCIKTSGECERGCEDGWYGITCDKECSDGFYGYNCSISCGKCKNDTVCLKSNGTCTSGCQIGYEGHQCQDVCRNGTYGDACSEICGKCNASMSCDHINGSCPDGCEAGWIGEKCLDKCENGTFGPGCIYNCGNCLNGTSCDFGTGLCPLGCEIGYKPDTCLEECEGGKYGWNCENACGRCNGTIPCDSANGTCPYGCSPGWEGPLCEARIITYPEKQTENNLVIILPVVIVAVFIALVIIIIVIINLLQRKSLRRDFPVIDVFDVRHRGKSEKSEEENDSCAFGMTAVEVDPETDDKKDEATDNNDDAESDMKLDLFSDNFELKEDGLLYCNESLVSTAMNIADLRHIVTEKKTNGILTRECLALTCGTRLQQPYEKGKFAGIKNKKKTLSNSHLDELPSVEISEQKGLPNTHCMNINYKDGVNKRMSYIATNGPTASTVHNFWKMAWETNCEKIVCISQPNDTGTNKLVEYWPNEEIIECQNFKVRLVKENKYGSFVIKTLELTNIQNDDTRTVFLFHFTSWSERSLPDLMGLVLFRHKVNGNDFACNGPTIVHGSVYRTGLYIAFNGLLRIGRKSCEIDVFQYLRQMKKGGFDSIQTQNQYVTLHEILVEAFMTADSSIKVADFPDVWIKINSKEIPKNENRCRQEFQILNSIRPVLDDNSLNEATSPKNKSKNRCLSVLPDERYRVRLESYPPDSTDYVNAVKLPSLKASTGFLTTQYPLPHTVQDFWSVVYEQKSSIVVILEPNKETLCIFPEEDTELRFGALLLSCLYTVTSDGVNKSQMTLIKDGDEDEMQLVVFDASTWPWSESIPPSPKFLFDLVQRVGKEQADLNSFITVVCLDGSTKCGLFCTIANVLENIEAFEEADLLFTARQLQMRRPEFLEDEEQYEFCYTVIHDFLDYKSKDIWP